MEPVSTSRIAVLGLALELYQEALPEYMQVYRQQLARFQAELADLATVQSGHFCFRQEHVSEAVAAATRQQADALVLVPLCYTASMMSVPALLETELPIVVWNTQDAREVTADYDFDTLLRNHVTQGTQDITNVLLRNGCRFGMVSGHHQDPRALGRLADWLRAARACRFARGLRVGRLGQPDTDMGDTLVDEERMRSDWGPETVAFSLARFAELLSAVTDEEVELRFTEDCQRFDIAEDVSADIHRLSSRLECALRQLLDENAVDAFTMNFRDVIADGHAPTLPFLGINKLLAEGLGYAGEGDAMTAALMAQTRQLCGMATFTEIYTVDYVHNRMVMSHMQECNPAMARRDRPVRLVRKDFWALGVQPYVGMHFTLEPGPVTLIAVNIDEHGRFFYVVGETAIFDMPPFANFDIPHWLIDLDEPVGDFLARYSLAGGPHHLVAAPGHGRERVAKLGHLQGLDVRCV